MTENTASGNSTLSLTRIKIGEEERVDEGRLSKAGFSDHHQGEFKAFFDGLPVDLKQTKIVTLSCIVSSNPRNENRVLSNVFIQ
jgi:hypothetical protein